MVLPPLTVTVPVGTKGPTARRVVCTTNNLLTCVQQLVHEVYVCMYTVYFLFAACRPACRNGGTCLGSSSSAYCVCPSGYNGSYCQKRGTYAHNLEHACVCVCVCVCMCVCVCVCSLTQTMGPTTPCTLLRMKSPMTMVNPFATNGSNHWILHQLNRSIKLIHGQGTKVLFASTSDCLQQLVHFKQTYVHCVFHICSL